MGVHGPRYRAWPRKPVYLFIIKEKRVTKQFSFFLICTLLLASCDLWKTNIVSFDQKTFEKERQLWLEQDLQNYSFYLTYIGGKAMGNWRGAVAVQDGVLYDFFSNALFIRRPPVPVDYVTERPYMLEWIDSISTMYDNIINDSRKENRYSSIVMNLEYDSEYHFLKSYLRAARAQPQFEYQYPGLGATGDWVKISNFTRE